MGQPPEYALSVCVLSVRLGEALGLSESELREVYYLALLRHIGCNAETYWIVHPRVMGRNVVTPLAGNAVQRRRTG